MLELKKKNKLTEKTYVWKIGMKCWVKAGKVHDLKPLFKKPCPVPEELEEKNNCWDILK